MTSFAVQLTSVIVTFSLMLYSFVIAFQGTVLVIAVCYVTVNLLVDLSYGLADPRIRRA